MGSPERSMIHYELQCGAEHRFDGWFKDSASFAKQAARGLLECPICGDTRVIQALMTPSLPKKGREMLPVPASPPAAPEAPSKAAPVAMAGPKMPAQLRGMLTRLRQEIERNCDYVGEEFADEARRIHCGESERRGIYGEASDEEAESLAEEGIQVQRIPWLPRADG
jgi:hypothetical protein